MVWQEGSEIIVMATEVMENNRKKSEKYWPDKDHSQKYGNVIIKCVEQMWVSAFSVAKYIANVSVSLIFHWESASEIELIMDMRILLVYTMWMHL